MCKTGRKIYKINFNKFIWLYWKMKKNIIYIFLGGFPVAGMRKKKCVKKNLQELGWATAQFLGLVTIQQTV